MGFNQSNKSITRKVKYGSMADILVEKQRSLYLENEGHTSLYNQIVHENVDY